MLTSVRFESFRSLADVTIPLEQFTVLVGPNGAGKTSVLRGLQMLATVFVNRGDIGSLEHRTKGATTDARIVVLAPFGQLVFVVGSEFGSQTNGRFGTIEQEAAGLARAKSLSLNADDIRRETPLAEDDTLQAGGGGLASALASLALTEPAAITRISEDLASVVPHARGVRAKRNRRGGGSDTFAFEVEFDGVGWIAGTEVSEGTAIALALITLLHLENPPELLLIDDIDRGLHPQAQRELVAILRRLLGRRPQTQIVATTHSPYLLDAFKPEEVCILNLGADGHSVCRRLADHPEIDKWRDAMASGELWASLGEDWIREPAGGS